MEGLLINTGGDRISADFGISPERLRELFKDMDAQTVESNGIESEGVSDLMRRFEKISQTPSEFAFTMWCLGCKTGEEMEAGRTLGILDKSLDKLKEMAKGIGALENIRTTKEEVDKLMKALSEQDETAGAAPADFTDSIHHPKD